MKDTLGDRMKKYENVSRHFLPCRTYTVLRLDGKAFHTYTKGLKKPFDADLSNDIDESVKTLLKEIQGAKFAYCQSDEISILMSDVENINSQTWFDGNIQKICSVSSSVLTAQFNARRVIRECINYSESTKVIKLANFDCRVFTVPDRIEVMNYFRWRNQDCRRNSISMVAYSLFSHKELQHKSSLEKIQMIWDKTGKTYEESYSESERYGRFIHKKENGFVVNSAWDFSNDEGKLLKYIPEYGYETKE